MQKINLNYNKKVLNDSKQILTTIKKSKIFTNNK